jgi:hypothetical protein
MGVERHVGRCSLCVWEPVCGDSVIPFGDVDEAMDGDLGEGLADMNDPRLLSSRVNRGRGGYWLSMLRSTQCTQDELCSLYYKTCVSAYEEDGWVQSQHEPGTHYRKVESKLWNGRV